MSKFYDPSGKSTFGIALCARCSRKFSLDDLHSDPNSPGLMVCSEDLDDYDPYRLAPRPSDPIALRFNRPDRQLGTDPLGVISDDGDFFIITDDDDEYLVP